MADDHDTVPSPLTHEQVLDELELLAGVEHALVVEYLSVQAALGHDLAADEGGATTDQGIAAASTAAALAQDEMRLLRAVNQGLVAAGRFPSLARATSIASGSAAEIPLGPPTAALLERLLEREERIAAAVDERYVRLRPAVTTAPVFEGEILDALRPVIVDQGPTHAAGVTALHTSLGDPPPTGFLRATRRVGADAFEDRLLEISDEAYQAVLAALRAQLAAPDADVGATFRFFAIDAMNLLDDANRVLVQRGLLPPFTLN